MQRCKGLFRLFSGLSGNFAYSTTVHPQYAIVPMEEETDKISFWGASKGL